MTKLVSKNTLENFHERHPELEKISLTETQRETLNIALKEILKEEIKKIILITTICLKETLKGDSKSSEGDKDGGTN